MARGGRHPTATSRHARQPLSTQQAYWQCQLCAGHDNGHATIWGTLQSPTSGSCLGPVCIVGVKHSWHLKLFPSIHCQWSATRVWPAQQALTASTPSDNRHRLPHVLYCSVYLNLANGRWTTFIRHSGMPAGPACVTPSLGLVFLEHMTIVDLSSYVRRQI